MNSEASALRCVTPQTACLLIEGYQRCTFCDDTQSLREKPAVIQLQLCIISVAAGLWFATMPQPTRFFPSRTSLYMEEKVDKETFVEILLTLLSLTDDSREIWEHSCFVSVGIFSSVTDKRERANCIRVVFDF
jgi:hypothetical protein